MDITSQHKYENVDYPLFELVHDNVAGDDIQNETLNAIDSHLVNIFKDYT